MAFPSFGVSNSGVNDGLTYPCFEALLTKKERGVLQQRAKMLNKMHPIEYLFLIRSMHPFWSQAQRNDLWVNLGLNTGGAQPSETFREAKSSVTNGFLLQTLNLLEQKNMVMGRLVLHDQIQAMYQKKTKVPQANHSQIDAQGGGSRKPVRKGRIDPVLAHSLRVDKFVSSVEGLHPMVAMGLYARAMDKETGLFAFHLMSDKFFLLSLRLFANVFFRLQHFEQEDLVAEAFSNTSKESQSILLANADDRKVAIATALEELEIGTENIVSWKIYLSQDYHVNFIKTLCELLVNRGHNGFQRAVGREVPEYAEKLAIVLEVACRRFFGLKQDYAQKQLSMLAPLLASYSGQELPLFEKALKSHNFSAYVANYSGIALKGLKETLARPGIREGLNWWKYVRQGVGVIEWEGSMNPVAKTAIEAGAVKSDDEGALWALFLQFLFI